MVPCCTKNHPICLLSKYPSRDNLRLLWGPKEAKKAKTKLSKQVVSHCSLKGQFVFNLLQFKVVLQHPIRREVSSNKKLVGSDGWKHHGSAWRAKIMTLIWETLFSSDPLIRLPSYWTHVGLYELTLCHSRVIDSPRALPLGLQRNKNTIRCPSVTRRSQDTGNNNYRKHWRAFVKNTLLFVPPKNWKLGPLAPFTTPPTCYVW